MENYSGHLRQGRLLSLKSNINLAFWQECIQQINWGLELGDELNCYNRAEHNKSPSALHIGSSVPFFWIPHICVNICYLFFSFWLTSYCMTVFRSIHVSANGTILFLFMAEEYSIVYMCHIFFIHSSVNEHLGCFHVWAIVNSAAINIRVHVSFGIMVFSRYMLRSAIAGS